MLLEDAARELRVLIVDNDPDSIHLLRDIFYTLNIKYLSVAHDATRAIQHLKAQPHSFVIIDMDMSRFKSLKLVQEIRQELEPTVYAIPIVALSGNVTKKQVSQARDVGVTEFITRPISVKGLENLVVSMLEQPRNFIISRNFIGPDRRRKTTTPPDGKEKRSTESPEDTKVIPPPFE